MTDYMLPLWDKLRERKLKEGWPLPGEQEDGTVVVWASNPRAYEPTHVVTYPNHYRFLLSQKVKPKVVLLLQIYLQLGHDEHDKAAVEAFLKQHDRLTIAKIKERYRQQLQ